MSLLRRIIQAEEHAKSEKITTSETIDNQGFDDFFVDDDYSDLGEFEFNNRGDDDDRFDDDDLPEYTEEVGVTDPIWRMIISGSLKRISNLEKNLGIKPWFIRYLAVTVLIFFASFAISLAILYRETLYQQIHLTLELSIGLASAFILLVMGLEIHQLRTARQVVIDSQLQTYRTDYTQYSDLIELEKESQNLSRIAERNTYKPIPLHHPRLSQADLPLIPAEYILLRLVTSGILGMLSFWLLPQLTALTIVASMVGFMLPQVWLNQRRQDRLTRIAQQLPYALEIWVQGLHQRQSLQDSLSRLQANFPNPLAAEFKRIIQETLLGIRLSEALYHFQARNPIPPVPLVVQAINLHHQYGGSLAQMLEHIQTWLAYLDQIRRRHGYNVFFHDLMAPLIIAMIFLQWVLLEAYFRTGWEDTTSQTALLLAYACVSLAVLINAESGKRVRRLEKIYHLASLRDARLMSLIMLIRIVSLIGLIHLHTLDLPLIVLAWLWIVIICVETPYPLIPLLIVMITITSQVDWQIYWNDLPTPSFNVVITPSIFIGLAFLSLLLVLFSVFVQRRRLMGYLPLESRLAQYGDRELPASLQELEMGLSIQERVIIPLWSVVLSGVEYFSLSAQVMRIQSKIRQAGLQKRVETKDIFLRQFSLGLAWGLGSLAILLYNDIWFNGIPVLMVAATFGGWYFPILHLNLLIRQRQARLEQLLPEGILFLELGLEAGLTVEAAMQTVYDMSDHEIGDLFGSIIYQIRYGKTRAESLKDHAQDLAIPSFHYLVASLLQGQYTPKHTTTLSQLRLKLAEEQTAVMDKSLKTALFWHYAAGVIILPIGIAIWLLTPLIAG